MLLPSSARTVARFETVVVLPSEGPGDVTIKTTAGRRVPSSAPVGAGGGEGGRCVPLPFPLPLAASTLAALANKTDDLKTRYASAKREYGASRLMTMVSLRRRRLKAGISAITGKPSASSASSLVKIRGS